MDTQASIRSFFHFSTHAYGRTNQPTDRWMDGRMERPSYRGACPQLKMLFAFASSFIRWNIWLKHAGIIHRRGSLLHHAIC